MCQAYLRPIITEKSEKDREEILKTIETTISEDVSAEGIRKKVDELNNAMLNDKISELDQESTRKLVKLLERKRRKHERIERKLKHTSPVVEDLGVNSTPYIKKTKYTYCGSCKNPKSANCDFSLCRSCCKDKVWTEKVECKGDFDENFYLLKKSFRFGDLIVDFLL